MYKHELYNLVYCNYAVHGMIPVSWVYTTCIHVCCMWNSSISFNQLWFTSSVSVVPNLVTKRTMSMKWAIHDSSFYIYNIIIYIFFLVLHCPLWEIWVTLHRSYTAAAKAVLEFRLIVIPIPFCMGVLLLFTCCCLWCVCVYWGWGEGDTFKTLMNPKMYIILWFFY